MARKTVTKPKLTDAERHKRFVEMAREVEADESPGALDRAFNRIEVKRVTKTAPRRKVRRGA